MSKSMVEQVNEELQNLMAELNSFKASVDYLNNAKSLVQESLNSVKSVEDNFNDRIRELKDTYDSFLALNDSADKVMTKLNTINFPARLDQIEETVKDTLKTLESTKQATVDEVQRASQRILDADFDRKFEKMLWEYNKTLKGITDLTAYIERQKISDNFENLEKYLDKVVTDTSNALKEDVDKIITDTVNEFKELNVKARIDKLDTTISNISSGINNIQARIERMESTLKSKIEDSIRKQEAMSKSLSGNLSAKVRDIEDMMNKNFGYQRINTLVTWLLMAVIIFMFVAITLDFI